MPRRDVLIVGGRVRHTVSARCAATLLGIPESEVIRRCETGQPGWRGWRCGGSFVVGARTVLQARERRCG